MSGKDPEAENGGMRVAIIGGGVAGLAAAYALRQAALEVDLFEAAGRLGGRVSTRRHGAAQFDDGAQFFRPEAQETFALLRESLPARDLVDIPDGVVPFASDGRLTAGDAAQNALPKLVYRSGIAQLPRLLALAAKATVHLGFAATGLRRERGHWRIESPRGTTRAYDVVVLTPPAPVAAAIVAASTFDRETRDRLEGALRAVEYRGIISIAFGLHHLPGRPLGAYALVNLDRGHAISWLAFEHAKPGYVPNDQAVIVAQMADAWSRPRMASQDREITADASAEVAGLLQEPIVPVWCEVTRWPFALPNATADPEGVSLAQQLGLYIAGDGVAGPRAHLALESGRAAAARIRLRL